MSQQVYYLKRGDKLIGPHNVTTIKKLSEDFKIKPTDLISRSKEGPWRKFGDVEEKLYGLATSSTQTVATATKTAVNPNLMACPDCKESISRKARACPHCGSPNESVTAMEVATDDFGGLDYVPPMTTPAYLSTPPVTRPSTPQQPVKEQPAKSNGILIAACGGLLLLLVILGGGFFAYSTFASSNGDESVTTPAEEPTERKVEIRRELFAPLQRQFVQYTNGRLEVASEMETELKLLRPALKSEDEKTLFVLCEFATNQATALEMLEASRLSLTRMHGSMAEHMPETQEALRRVSRSDGEIEVLLRKQGEALVARFNELDRAMKEGKGLLAKTAFEGWAILDKQDVEKFSSQLIPDILYVNYEAEKKRIGTQYKAAVATFEEGLYLETVPVSNEEPSEGKSESTMAASDTTKPNQANQEAEAGQRDMASPTKAEQLKEKLRRKISQNKPRTDIAIYESRLVASIGNLETWINNNVRLTGVEATSCKIDQRSSLVYGGGTVAEITLLVSPRGKTFSIVFKLALEDGEWKPLFRVGEENRKFFAASWTDPNGMRDVAFNSWIENQAQQLIDKLQTDSSWLK